MVMLFIYKISYEMSARYTAASPQTSETQTETRTAIKVYCKLFLSSYSFCRSVKMIIVEFSSMTLEVWHWHNSVPLGFSWSKITFFLILGVFWSGATPGQQRHPGSSRDLYWLTLNIATVRGLCHWNFHLLSFWLALSLLETLCA